jgi:MFS family permease
MALAPDWRWLIPALMLYQLSVFAMPAFYAYLSESNRDGNPNRLFATIASASNAGVVVSPFIAGWLAEHAGLRLVYVYSALLFGVATLAFSRIPEQELGTREKRIPVRQLSRDRWFMVEMVYIFLFFLVIDVGQVMVPNYLSEVHHVSLMQIGQLGSVGAIGLLLLTLLLGRIPAERRDALLFTQILALAALVLWAGLPTGLGIAVAYLIHGGNRLAVPLFSGRLAFFLPSRLRNLGFGFRETAMRLSFAIGPFLAGWLYDFHPSWPLLVSMAGLIIAMLLTLLLPAPNNSLSTDHYAPGPLPTRVRK